MRVKLLLVAALLVAASAPVPAGAGSTPRQIEYATVEVVGFLQTRSGYDAAGWGSGTLVDTSGLVLTAFHVVGDPSTGKLLNPDGLAGIAMVQTPGEAALPAYLGKVVTYSVSLDLALIDVSMQLDGTRLPQYTFFPALPLPGLRDPRPNVGDALTAYGFATGFDKPLTGVGGKLYRSGPVSGFGGVPMVVSSTAVYAGGLTGGPVVNADGVLAGISLGMSGRGANAQAVVRPWEEARLWASGQVTATQGAASVVVAGRVVDHHTRRGLTRGVFLVLKPNVSVDDFLADPNDRDVAARGETDRNGSFVTDPPVAFGVGYNMVVYAQGYQLAYSAQPIVLDARLCPNLPRCDLGIMELDTVPR